MDTELRHRILKIASEGYKHRDIDVHGHAHDVARPAMHGHAHDVARPAMHGHAHEPLTKTGAAISGPLLLLMAASTAMDFGIGKRHKKIAKAWKDGRKADLAGNLGMAALNFAPGGLGMLGKAKTGAQAVNTATKGAKALSAAGKVGTGYEIWDTGTGWGSLGAGGLGAFTNNKPLKALGKGLDKFNPESAANRHLDKKHNYKTYNFTRTSPHMQRYLNRFKKSGDTNGHTPYNQSST